jgi:DNA-binding transcriptional LysR family regulator
VMFPPAPFTAAVAAFQKKFPSTLLNFDVESSAVVEPVLDGRCSLGIVGSWSRVPANLTRHPLLTVSVPIVVSPQHPLAILRAPISAAALEEHIQLVHIDPADVSPSQAAPILSARFWRLSHLGAKLAFLRAGLGYGRIPLHLIEADLASGALVQIRTEDAPSEGYVIAMSAIYRTDSPPGPAGRWFIERLKHQDAQPTEEKQAPLARTSIGRQAAAG